VILPHEKFNRPVANHEKDSTCALRLPDNVLFEKRKKEVLQKVQEGKKVQRLPEMITFCDLRG